MSLKPCRIDLTCSRIFQNGFATWTGLVRAYVNEEEAGCVFGDCEEQKYRHVSTGVVAVRNRAASTPILSRSRFSVLIVKPPGSSILS